MKRIFSKNDFKAYTLMGRILSDLELEKKDYLWLISDIEAYPNKKEYQELMDSNSYLLLTSSEFISMLKEDDFQWVWAIFSAIPSHYGKEDILKYNLPKFKYLEEENNTWQDEPKIQHPYAEFEIYAFDSSYMFIVSDNEELISRFKKCYPKYIEE